MSSWYFRADIWLVWSTSEQVEVCLQERKWLVVREAGEIFLKWFVPLLAEVLICAHML